jgi:hypothetical protein
MERGRESPPGGTARHEADGEGESMKNHAAQDSGTALIVAMVLMLVLTVMLIGFYFVTTGEQKVAASNRDNGVTYYAAVAGLEQMSNLMANYFSHTASPTPAEIVSYTTTASNFQSLPGITSTYTLYCTVPGTTAMVLCSSVGNVLGSSNGAIGGNGALAGLEGIITPFQLTVLADGPSNTEVKLTRTVQEVAVPIFEFGIFSDSDLSFHAGSNFSFGGRTHTNGNLYLAEDSTSTLLLDDHVTAAKGIIRAQLSNGYVIQTGGSYSSWVDVLTTSGGCPTGLTGSQSGACRSLGLTEGSVTGGPGSTENPNWKTLSLTTYNGFIQDGTTGAKVLNLAIALPGINSQPIAMIQRPPASPPATTAESPTSALGMARFYNQASLRILLSDTQADIMNLPGIDASEQPYPLAEYGSTALTNMPYTIQRTTSIPSTYCPQNSNCYLPPADACHPPLAESVGSSDTDYMLAQNTTLLGGYIKIEMQLGPQAPGYSAGKWQDVTEEILAQGISRDVASGTAMPAPTVNGSSTSGSLSTYTTYYYEVTAVTALGESAGTAQSVKTYSNKTVTVTWAAVTGATGYNVYRTTTPGTYTGTGNGVISLVVGTPQGTSWVSPYTPTATFTDSGAISPTSSASGPPSSSCTNNSIVHLEEAAPGVTLGANLMNVLTPTKFVPINMYDAREGEVRDNSGPTTSSLNGIMNLVEIDVRNLQQWFAGNIATSGKYAINGPDALNNSGYILYTSDRRMNCADTPTSLELEGVCTNGETGEFGNEDIINPSVTSGAPNGVLDTCTPGVTACPPEDVDGDGVFRTYGAYAHPIATPSTTVAPTGTTPTGKWNAIISSVANTTAGNPAFVRITASQAQKNSVVVFRRALRLVNGTLGNLPPLAAAQAATCSGGTAGGFSVASENPVYVQGDYNASVANAFNDAAPLCHVPASVMGDTVTLLSNAWTPGAQSGTGDANSFANPTNSGNRVASTTYYRMAVMGGKTNSFPQPTTWGVSDTGTDGGVHNFLRYDENWSGQTLYYLGSMASFYLSRQGTGIYKYGVGNTVYQPPTRNYTFDTDFQNINKLPPGTPRFTDVNALSYYQSILPSQ